jgi:hypothetical protein
VRPDMVEARLTIGGLDRLDDGFHVDAFPKSNLFVVGGPCLPPYRANLAMRV